MSVISGYPFFGPVEVKRMVKFVAGPDWSNLDFNAIRGFIRQQHPQLGREAEGLIGEALTTHDGDVFEQLNSIGTEYGWSLPVVPMSEEERQQAHRTGTVL